MPLNSSRRINSEEQQVQKLARDGAEFRAKIYNSDGQWQACFWTRDSLTRNDEFTSDIEPFDNKFAAHQLVREQARLRGFQKIKIESDDESA